MNEKLQPIGNRILAKRIESEKKTKSGLFLPDTAQKKQEIATVLTLGTGENDKNGNPTVFPVKVGDDILMDKYSGHEVTIEDEDLIIINLSDIIAIVRN